MIVAFRCSVEYAKQGLQGPRPDYSVHVIGLGCINTVCVNLITRLHLNTITASYQPADITPCQSSLFVSPMNIYMFNLSNEEVLDIVIHL